MVKFDEGCNLVAAAADIVRCARRTRPCDHHYIVWFVKPFFHTLCPLRTVFAYCAMDYASLAERLFLRFGTFQAAAVAVLRFFRRQLTPVSRLWMYDSNAL